MTDSSSRPRTAYEMERERVGINPALVEEDCVYLKFYLDNCDSNVALQILEEEAVASFFRDNNISDLKPSLIVFPMRSFDPNSFKEIVRMLSDFFVSHAETKTLRKAYDIVIEAGLLPALNQEGERISAFRTWHFDLYSSETKGSVQCLHGPLEGRSTLQLSPAEQAGLFPETMDETRARISAKAANWVLRVNTGATASAVDAMLNPLPPQKTLKL